MDKEEIKEIEVKSKHTFIQLVKYAVVGAISTLLDMGTLNLLVIFAHANVYLAATCGFLIGTTNGYILNRFWTFQLKGEKNFAKQFVQFAIVGGIGLALNNGLLYLFIEYGHLNYNVAKLIAVFIIFFWNFTMNKIWTFKNSGVKKWQKKQSA